MTTYEQTEKYVITDCLVRPHNNQRTCYFWSGQHKWSGIWLAPELRPGIKRRGHKIFLVSFPIVLLSFKEDMIHLCVLCLL